MQTDTFCTIIYNKTYKAELILWTSNVIYHSTNQSFGKGDEKLH